MASQLVNGVGAERFVSSRTWRPALRSLFNRPGRRGVTAPVDKDERDTDSAYGHPEVPVGAEVERRARLDRPEALDHQALGSNTPGSAAPAPVGYVAVGYSVDTVARVARALMSYAVALAALPPMSSVTTTLGSLTWPSLD